MDTSKLRKDLIWVVKHTAVLAFVLGLICARLPPEYRVLCDQLLKLCHVQP